MDFKRLENETDEQLVYRICSQKEIIGTWEDVADILNNLLGNNFSESAYRKKYQSFQKVLQENKSKLIEEDNYSKELDKKYEDIRKERIKLQTVNVERQRIDRAESRQELFYEYIGKVKETLPLPKFEEIFVRDDESKEYLLTLSDIHYGAKFKSMNNEYSPEIAKQRFELMTAYVIGFIEEHHLSKLKIVSLGDCIQGILRLKDLQLNDTSIVKSTVEVSRLIATFLNEISTFCYVEYYHVPKANHTQLRVLGAKANELGEEDLEYVIGHYVKDLCSDNYRINVHLEDEKTYIEIPIFDYEIVALHGHTIKNIESSIKDLSVLTRKFIDYCVLGHFHNGKEIPMYESCCNDCEVLVSPSFIGSDPYSDSLMCGGKSSIKIYGFSDIYGHTETYKYILN